MKHLTDLIPDLLSADLAQEIDNLSESPVLGITEVEQIACKETEPKALKCFTVLHLIEGSIELNLALQHYSIHAPALIFGYPGQLISDINIKVKKGFLFYTNTQKLILFYPKFIELNIFQLYGQNHLIKLSENNNAVLENINEQISSLQRSEPDVSKREPILDALMKLHILYCNYYIQDTEEEKAGGELVRSFFSMLNLEFDPTLKVTDYARRLNVTPNHLNAVMQKNQHKSVKRILKEKILRKACVLLIHTQMEVKEIAYELGYNYPQYFNRDFKNSMGMTPLAYRLASH